MSKGGEEVKLWATEKLTRQVHQTPLQLGGDPFCRARLLSRSGGAAGMVGAPFLGNSKAPRSERATGLMSDFINKGQWEGFKPPPMPKQ